MYTCSNLLIHVFVIVPFVSTIVSVTCVLVIESGVYDCIRSLMKRKPHHSVHLQLQSEQQQLPSASVPVQEVHILEQNHEREPLIAIVSNL